MSLRSGRLKDLIDQSLPDSYIVCHSTLPQGEFPDSGPAICKGFYDKYGDQSIAIRLMVLHDLLVEVLPPC